MKLLRTLALLAAILPGMAHASGNGTARTILTSASPTACTSIEAPTAPAQGVLWSITNTGPATSVFITLYDEGAAPTCAAADVVYGDGTTLTLGAGQVVTLSIPVTKGIAYKMSGALSNNLIIVHQ